MFEDGHSRQILLRPCPALWVNIANCAKRHARYLVLLMNPQAVGHAHIADADEAEAYIFHEDILL
ncbi:hypothetical protein D3C77_282910 [compost metagenome]